MVNTRQDKIEKQLEYAHQQLDRFLFRNYSLKVPQVHLYANKNLYKERKYSQTTRTAPMGFDVDLDYRMLLGDVDDSEERDKKALILRSVLREAVRIACMIDNHPYLDGSDYYEKQLYSLGIISYGGLPEMGLKLHTYICSNCHQIKILQQRRLPKSKDPSQQEHVKTSCCHARFEYAGHYYYNNPQLQKIAKQLGRGTFSAGNDVQ